MTLNSTPTGCGDEIAFCKEQLKKVKVWGEIDSTSYCNWVDSVKVDRIVVIKISTQELRILLIPSKA